ncbi:hypothetical protein Verru16b_02341 [Lacunisphaera limnophila]|uniref:Cobalt transport protein CbiN n=1 Tax=Lacunisphaera limnophila TaxID=1838286 RepID=A0A1D8AWL7_9BACT|nr:hypothetical protein [Lacunisphaera limnophila]AOS45262.1 hypothetical protein Verru16b_02341 [Lacunisphaera limnophila]
MKTLRLPSVLLAAALLLPAVAQAHPGHDGDHDFVWDFGHLTANPLATIACISLLVAAAWGVRRLVKGRPAARSVRVKRD